MELKELTERVKIFLDIENIDEMSKKIMKKIKENDVKFYEDFIQLFDISVEDKEKVSEVLSEDFMQKIFQYYMADRKEKMQDYTPVSLAKFVSIISGDNENVIDMCAGSGALTIQKWNLDKNKSFLLYEFDENVIPILLFNMAIRNIESVVCHADVLTMEIFSSWKIEKGDKFGIVKECNINEHINF